MAQVADDLPHYLLANPASRDFSHPPDVSAFLPGEPGVLTVEIPMAAQGLSARILVLQYTAGQRRTFYGAVGSSHVTFEPDPDADAFTLAVRLAGRGSASLGVPSVVHTLTDNDIFREHNTPVRDTAPLAVLIRSFLPQIGNRTAVERTRTLAERNVVTVKGNVEFDLSRGDVWTRAEGRATKRLLHGFLFLPEVAGAARKDQGLAVAAAHRVMGVFDAWQAVHGTRGTARDEMAWHDETTAQRMIHLLSWFDAVHTHLSEDEKRRFWSRLADTAALLSTDNFHATGNNHGMFQDWALLYYAVLAPHVDPRLREAYLDTAIRRLMAYFDSCFTSEGVHVENSPSYHLMASGYLRQLARVTAAMGHPRSRDYGQLLDKAARYATHALMPDGVYPPISDTTQSGIRRTMHAGLFADPEYEYAVHLGRTGRQPSQRTLVLPDTGYAVYRSSWTSEEAAFLFFSAAYNANYHKHSDDLSLFLRYYGVDLLCESGPYGYDYKHPYSQYAYSQFSHNSLVVDAKSLPRTDGKFDAVGLVDHQPEDAAMDATGTNARYADVRHTRRVRVMEQGDEIRIAVTDEVHARQNHDYELLWNLGPEVKSTVVDEGFRLRARGHQLLRARIESDTQWEIRRHEGVDKPAPRGWRFPAFGQAVPAQQLAVRFRGTSVSMTTNFTLLPINQKKSD